MALSIFCMHALQKHNIPTMILTKKIKSAFAVTVDQKSIFPMFYAPVIMTSDMVIEGGVANV